MKDNAPGQRRLTSWIESFLQWTANAPAPELFRIWSAIGGIAGALERRAWINTATAPLYPNMFLVLISPPGVGKDAAMVPMRDLWAATGMLNVAPISMTHKGMIDFLASAESSKNFPNPVKNSPEPWITYHSVLIAAPELGVLIEKHDLGYLSALNELFNCHDLFAEKQRHARNGEILRIERPHLHLIAGTQPKYLGELLPDAAYGMGFTARIIFVYWGTPVRVSLFDETRKDPVLRGLLIEDMKSMCRLCGPFSVDLETQQLLESWHMKGSDKDKPNHSKLMHYNARRILHVLKLCMVFCAARSNDMAITAEDFVQAKDLLLKTESLMPEVFKEMASGGQSAEIEEAFNFILRIHLGRKGPVPESLIIQFLSSRVPVNQIEFLLNAMIRGGMIKTVPLGSGELNLPNRERLFLPLALNYTQV